MLSSKLKDIRNRHLFQNIEKSRRVNKFLLIQILNNKRLTGSLSNSSLFSSICEAKKKLSLKAKVRISNRCVLTNRGRGVLRSYGLSRISMRNFMQFGILPGYSKAVW